MTTNNNPAHGPVSLDRLHQISEILSKAAAQSDGGNLGYAMADAVKVINGVIASFGAEPVPCPKCNDTGMADSGGVQPWGEPILIECDCRAAMLQAGNSPVTPDCWIPVIERMPERDVYVQLYCADSREQMVGYMEREESEGYFRFSTWRSGKGIYCKPTHWMPLPAAPKQEVK
ncbi:DUF551 domain-containing protein [Citrobacter braakii]|uniref:DUF551 domain-containing protein n=1 Tax=Citrobacter braakii TaxID=57706 RepID=UPI003C2B3F1A